MSRILVTDGNNRTSLYAVRSLGSKDLDVAVCERSNIKHPISFYSKYCKDKILISPDQYIASLAELSDKFDAIIPISTKTSIPIAMHRDLFKNVSILIPDHSTLSLADNKRALLEFAKEISIPIPTTLHSGTPFSKIKNEIGLPFVVKPIQGSGAKGVYYVKNESDFAHAKSKIKNTQYLIQEYIKGPGYGFSALLAENSKVIAQFTHKRIREYPVTGGISTFCESVKNEKMEKYGLKLLKKLKWQGLAMVEFKLDEKDGIPKLMEINPRFWGSMPLAIKSGVDFPYLLYKAAIGSQVPRIKKYPIGVKLRFTSIDILSCIHLLKKNKDFSMLKNIVMSYANPKVKEGLISLSDPLPSIVHLIDRFQRIKLKDSNIEN